MNGMLAGLVRRREWLMVLLLVAVGAQILLELVSFRFNYWARAEPVVLVAALASAIWCAAGTPARHVRMFLVLAVVGAGLGVLIDLIRAVSFGFRPQSLSAVAFVDVLLSQAVSLIGILAAVLVLVHQPTGATAATAATPYGVPVEAEGPPAVVSTPLEQRPTWQPDHASGAAWTTAGDAASGAPGTGWGDAPAGGNTWQPIPAGSSWAPRPDPGPPLPGTASVDPRPDGPAALDSGRPDGPDWSSR